MYINALFGTFRHLIRTFCTVYQLLVSFATFWVMRGENILGGGSCGGDGTGGGVMALCRGVTLEWG